MNTLTNLLPLLPIVPALVLGFLAGAWVQFRAERLHRARRERRAAAFHSLPRTPARPESIGTVTLPSPLTLGLHIASPGADLRTHLPIWQVEYTCPKSFRVATAYVHAATEPDAIRLFRAVTGLAEFAIYCPIAPAVPAGEILNPKS